MRNALRVSTLLRAVRRHHGGSQFQHQDFGPAIDLLRLNGVEVIMLALLDAVFVQQQMPARFESALRETAAHAFQRTAIQREYRPSGTRDADEVGHIAPNAGDARHFGQSGPVQLNSDMIGHLRSTGTAGTGIHQWQLAMLEPHDDTPGHIEDLTDAVTLDRHPGVLQPGLASGRPHCS